MSIKANITELIGNTPLVKLNHLSKDGYATIALKLESHNPGGSIKDRIGLAMINDAQNQRLISPSTTTLIEPTSGNTGIALALVAASRRYKLILTMPETMSIERRKLLEGLGAQLHLTPGIEGMNGAVALANQLSESIKDAYILQQFDNPSNPKIHQTTTAEEIWRDTEGKIDIFVAGVGTGGTISGVGLALKSRRPSIQIVAVEPASSPLISQKLAGLPLTPAPHKIQGIGANFIPKNLDLSVIDEVIPVSDEEAFASGKELMKQEGILGGISSGATLFAALKLAMRPENKGKLIVAIVASTAERYISTPLFA